MSNALAFIGGAPKLLVCDNLRAGVTAACRYELGINRTYQEMAAHYDSAVLPTRVRRPRDKDKVEVAVLIVERFILARLRHRRFLSLGELNARPALVRSRSRLRSISANSKWWSYAGRDAIVPETIVSGQGRSRKVSRAVPSARRSMTTADQLSCAQESGRLPEGCSASGGRRCGGWSGCRRAG